MSQRERAGFNWPPPSIPAEEPVSISPVTVSRAGPFDMPYRTVDGRSSSRPLRCISDKQPSIVRLPLSPSAALVVGHPALSNTSRAFGSRPSKKAAERTFSDAVGVAHPACQTTRPSKEFSGTFASGFDPSFQSRVVGVGVGHGAPVKPLSDVRRAEARSAGISRPDGVARSFQVRAYKVEPSEAVLACNLLAKNDRRAALFDEPVEGGPKVPLVSKPAAFACRAEGLARARAGPDRPVVGPSGAAQGVGPDADAGEEVDLGELS